MKPVVVTPHAKKATVRRAYARLVAMARSLLRSDGDEASASSLPSAASLAGCLSAVAAPSVAAAISVLGSVLATCLGAAIATSALSLDGGTAAPGRSATIEHRPSTAVQQQSAT